MIIITVHPISRRRGDAVGAEMLSVLVEVDEVHVVGKS